MFGHLHVVSDKHKASTARQRRELEYHRRHAEAHKGLLSRPFSYDVVHRSARRWENAYWQMYSYLIRQPLHGKKTLVAGCGFGDDALRLAKLGADVYAYDLSPESLTIAKALARREGLSIKFERMPAEDLRYENDFFDAVIMRDVLHHVDIPLALNEIVRVSKNDALIIVNEVYSHSLTNHVRYSRLVEKYLYPALKQFVYGGQDVYITEDERKLTEKDILQIKDRLQPLDLEKYFNFLVNRVLPDKFYSLNKVDRFLLICLTPLARFLGGRILFVGRIAKHNDAAPFAPDAESFLDDGSMRGESLPKAARTTPHLVRNTTTV